MIELMIWVALAVAFWLVTVVAIRQERNHDEHS